jgi:hypothetical protein
MRAFGRLGFGAWSALTLAACVACGGSATEGSNAGGMSSGGAVGSAASGGRVTLGGASNGGTKPTSGGATSTSGGTIGSAEVDPAAAVAGASVMGNGPCKGHELGELVMNVHAKYPELADIQEFYDPKSALVGDGSFIYAFPNAAGFRLVFTRGSGDCESGCIDKSYFYFESDGACSPVMVGQYSRTYSSASNCFQIQGKPLWGFPGEPPPSCGGSTSSDVSGSYALEGTGSDTPCSTDPGPVIDVARSVTLEVTHDVDVGTATVVISGTGNDLVDGNSYSGKVSGSTLYVDVNTMNPPNGSDCGSTSYFRLSYDFSAMMGSIWHEEARYPDCASMIYCKGTFQLSLTPE